MIAVTSRALCREPFLDRIGRLAEAGPELVILREKDLPHDDYVRLASDCLAVCEAYGVPLSLNSDVAAARELGVRRVHLPMTVLRDADPGGFDLVGASVHSPDEAAEAESLGADYLIAGHVFETACKPFGPRGTDFLREVCRRVRIPVYAIGGVTPSNYPEVLGCGAAGAAVMSFAMTCDDPSGLVRGLAPTGRGIGSIRYRPRFRCPWTRGHSTAPAISSAGCSRGTAGGTTTGTPCASTIWHAPSAPGRGATRTSSVSPRSSTTPTTASCSPALRTPATSWCPRGSRRRCGTACSASYPRYRSGAGTRRCLTPWRDASSRTPTASTR